MIATYIGYAMLALIGLWVLIIPFVMYLIGGDWKKLLAYPVYAIILYFLFR